jgi:hypothetical protein
VTRIYAAFIVGVALVAVGAGLWWLPAGLIAAGVLMLFAAVYVVEDGDG